MVAPGRTHEQPPGDHDGTEQEQQEAALMLKPAGIIVTSLFV
jgi:hypothetical protein